MNFKCLCDYNRESIAQQDGNLPLPLPTLLSSFRVPLVLDFWCGYIQNMDLIINCFTSEMTKVLPYIFSC